MNYLSHQNGKLYSVANSATVLVQNVSFEIASAALLDAGYSVVEAASLLNNPAPASEWWATILSASVATGNAVEQSFAEFEQRYEANELAGQMNSLRRLLVNISAELEAATEWEATVLQLGDEIDRIREVVVAEDAYFDSERVEQLIYDTVLNTELGKRFLALQQAKRVA